MKEETIIKVNKLVEHILESPGQLEFKLKLEDDDLDSTTLKEIKEWIKCSLPAYEPLWSGYCVKILWMSKDEPVQIYCNYWAIIGDFAESRIAKDIVTITDHLEELDSTDRLKYLASSYPPGVLCI